MSDRDITTFRETVWNYYRDHARSMPWRDQPTPYNVVISEVMLQQTQVGRVLVKFDQFIRAFPDFQSLAAAPTTQLLEVWQGMGYNRRALWLQRLAHTVVNEYKGTLPSDPQVLKTLPGIGPNTTGSIAAFAYNQSVVFIETNIRRVFIHYFFEDGNEVHDKELMPLIERALDHEHPREWYYALMDYGSHLAKTIPNPNRRSRHYAIQGRFEGSNRQLRGQLLRYFLEYKAATETELMNHFSATDRERLLMVLSQYLNENFIKKVGARYLLVD